MIFDICPPPLHQKGTCACVSNLLVCTAQGESESQRNKIVLTKICEFVTHERMIRLGGSCVAFSTLVSYFAREVSWNPGSQGFASDSRHPVRSSQNHLQAWHQPVSMQTMEGMCWLHTVPPPIKIECPSISGQCQLKEVKTHAA